MPLMRFAAMPQQCCPPRVRQLAAGGLIMHSGSYVVHFIGCDDPVPYKHFGAHTDAVAEGRKSVWPPVVLPRLAKSLPLFETYVVAISRPCRIITSTLTANPDRPTRHRPPPAT